MTVTHLDDSHARETIAALSTAMTEAASRSEGYPPLLMKDFHVSFVSPPNVDGTPASAAARLLQRGERSVHVEAQLRTPEGRLIAFAIGRLDAPDPFEALSTAAALAPRKRGVLRAIYDLLAEMSG